MFNAETSRILESMAAILEETTVPPWAKAVGFEQQIGAFKLFLAPREEYLFYTTPNKGGFRLRLDKATGRLALPPEGAKDGPGFTISGSVPAMPTMGMGPNRRLYYLAAKVIPNKGNTGTFDVRFMLRPSDAVGYSIFLASASGISAENVKKALNKRGASEQVAAEFLAAQVGKTAEFVK